jgi:hypothetical protein
MEIPKYKVALIVGAGGASVHRSRACSPAKGIPLAGARHRKLAPSHRDRRARAPATPAASATPVRLVGADQVPDMVVCASGRERGPFVGRARRCPQASRSRVRRFLVRPRHECCPTTWRNPDRAWRASKGYSIGAARWASSLRGLPRYGARRVPQAPRAHFVIEAASTSTARSTSTEGRFDARSHAALS